MEINKSSRGEYAAGARLVGSRVGIGVDIEDTSRFEVLCQNDHPFFHRFYTENELNLAKSVEDRASWLAGRYCSKESVAKAIMELGDPSPDFRTIEILARKDGCPLAHIVGSDRYVINISISHRERMVIAFAMVSIANERSP